MRVDLINETKLMQAGHKGTAIDAAISEVEQNPDLLAKWKVCFSNHNLPANDEVFVFTLL